MTEIESLGISIKADAKTAEKAIDSLVARLGVLSNSLSKINGSNLNGLSSGVQALAQGMQGFKGIGEKKFSVVADGITKLANINTQGLNSVAGSVNNVASAINSLSGIQYNNKGMQSLINSLTRLSNSNISALSNVDFTRLGNSLNSLATSLQSAPKIQQSIISMTNAIANLSRFGGNIPTVASSLGVLGNSLTMFMSTMANAPRITDSALAFTQAISSLAGAGAKAGVTASNLSALGVGIRNIMTTLSTAPKVSQNVIDMTNALANLSAQGSKVGSASRNMVYGLNRTSRSADRAKKSFIGLASAIGKFYANYFLVVRGFKALWKSIGSTADYIESYNYFNVALGKIGSDWAHQWEKYADKIGVSSAEKYADSFATRLEDKLKPLSGISVEVGADGKGLLSTTGMKNLGLNIQEVTQYASQLASVTNSLGQTGEVSLATSSAFTKLGADMSSLFNVDYSQVMNNLNSALIGQSRSVYRYGIDITNATLQTYAYELGLSKAVSEMTQAEKQQLRMIAILDQSRVSWGDLANTLESPSNLMRQFTNNLKETGMVLGQLFIPMLQYTLPVINGVTIAIKELLVSIAQLMGITIDFDAFGEGFNQTEGFEDLQEGIDGATESLKKYKNQAMDFDEINPIKGVDDSASLGNLTGGSIDLTDEILKATEEYEKAWQESYDNMESRSQEIANRIVNGFKNAFKNAGWYGVGNYISSGIADSLSNADFDSVHKGLENVARNIANFLNGLITPDLLGNVGKSFAKSLNAVINAKATLGENIDFKQVGKSIGAGINNFFDTFDFKTLGTSIGTWASGIFSALVSAIGEVEWKDVFSGLYKALAGLTSAIGIEDSTAIDMLVTSILAFKGISVVVGTIGNVLGKLKSLIAFITSNPWNMAITALSALAAAIIYAWADGDVDYMTEDLQKIADKADAAADAAADLRDELNNLDGDTFEGKELEILADKFYELSIQEGKSKDEMALLKEYSDDLVELMPDLKDKIDEQTGAYKGTRDELDKLVNKTKEYYKIQATEDIMKDIIRQMAQTELDLAAAEKVYKEAFTKQYEFLHDPKHQDPYSTSLKVSREYEDEYKKLALRTAKTQEDVKSLESTLEDLNNQYDIASGYLSGLNTEDKTPSVGLPSLPNATGVDMSIPLRLKWKIDGREIDFLGIGEESKSVGQKIVDGLASGISGNYSASTSIAKSMGSIASKMVEIYGTLSGKAKDQGKGLVWNLGNGMTINQSSATNAFTNITSALSNVISDKYSSLKNSVVDKGKNIASNFGNGITANKNNVSKAFESVVKDLSNIISNKYSLVKDDVISKGKNIASNFGKGITANKDNAPNAFKNVSSALTNTINKNYETIKSNVNDKGKSIVSNLISGMKANKDNATKAIENILKAVGNIASTTTITDKFKTAGKNILKGLIGGLNDKTSLSNLSTTVAGLGKSVANIFTGILDIHSPSRLFEKYAMYTIQGYNIGLEKYAPTTLDSMEDWSSSIANANMSMEYPSVSANSEELLLLRQQNMLLQALLNKETVEIKGDAKQIFKLVRKQANNYTIQTGEPAFAF